MALLPVRQRLISPEGAFCSDTNEAWLRDLPDGTVIVLPQPRR
jgi:hypothetical protein